MNCANSPRQHDLSPWDGGRPVEGRALHDVELCLPDGRVLGYADHGPVDGVPLLFFHGTPGARIVLSAQALATAARCGVRVVVPERPGYGLSTPQATRTLLSWAADVEALADHLGFARFAVAGASGGGPYALACAYAMPGRVSLVGLVCTAGRFTGRDDLRRLSPLNRLKFGVPRWAPWLLRADLALLTPVVRRWPALLTRLMAQRSAGDRATTAAMPDYQARLERLLAESFRQGSAGLYTDLVLGSRDWGFDLRHIDAPVELWHGEEDRMAPPYMARSLARELPNCTAHFLPDGGHLILGRPEVWETLMSRVVAPLGEGNTIRRTEQNVARPHARLTGGQDGWVGRARDVDRQGGGNRGLLLGLGLVVLLGLGFVAFKFLGADPGTRTSTVKGADAP